MVLHGGNDNNGNRALSDVWHARANGTGWTLVTSRAPARRSAAMAVDRASGRIVTTGGLDEVSHFASDVHASLDFGATWRRTSPSGAPFPGRYAHCMVHVNNEFTLCGGAAGTYHYREDCWTSADGGASWIQTAVSAPWGPRKQMGCAASPTGIMFLAGGRHLLNSTTHATRYEADVWASSDNGRSWSLLTEGGSWMGRSEPSLVYLQTSAKLVLLAGYSERRFNRYCESPGRPGAAPASGLVLTQFLCALHCWSHVLAFQTSMMCGLANLMEKGGSRPRKVRVAPCATNRRLPASSS